MSTRCHRCKDKTQISTMSIFNLEMICPSCAFIEKHHASYKKAKEAELEETRKGNLNFEGIGLPHDLRRIPQDFKEKIDLLMCERWILENYPMNRKD